MNRTLVKWIVCGAAGAWSAVASGQLGGLPPEVVSSSSVTSSQRDAIREHVSKHLPEIAGGEPDKVRRARAELVGMFFRGDDVSVSFRQAYAAELTGQKLADLARSENDLVAINALRIAGDVASSETLDIVEAHLGSSRSAVRYGAVAAAQRTLDQVRERFPAVTADRAAGLAATLGARLADEKDPLLADALTRALQSAAGVTRERYESVRAAGITELCRALSARLKTMESRDEDALVINSVVRAGLFLRDDLSANGATMPERLKVDAAGLGGDMLAWVAKQITGRKLPQVSGGDDEPTAKQKRDSRAAAINVAAAGEGVLFFAARGLNVTGVTQTNFKAELEKASSFEDARYVEAVRAIAGPGGLLTKPPFQFQASRFGLQ
ncbi:MAG: hypothetical protein HRU70_06195 [Phycisphaeraceae bacterium]|nr:MAG: hypothetical protein HRU70_06195 [Phycisphaeraceae bacterium]